tara:strand:- start:414 stop:857 length:444 start_codon:yes stop_codon:yes gene_type:complete
METVTLEVLGSPYPWRTPRWSPGGGVFRHPAVTAWQQRIRAVAHHAELVPIEGPVKLVMEFYVRRPRSHWTTTGRLRAGKPLACTSRRVGDLTNLYKAAEDALSGVAYTDDCLVVSSSATKRYAAKGETPRAFIHITRLEEDYGKTE